MRFRHLLSLGLVCVVALVACGGDEGGDPPGTTPSGTAGSPGTTPTEGAPPSSDDGAIFVEIDGTRYEFSVRSDIPFPAAPNTMIPTRCEPDFFRQGLFWVIAVAVDSDGRVPDNGWQVSSDLMTSGGFDDYGFKMRGGPDDREYRINEADPGSWTISGNRLQGEVNVTYWDSGAQQETTARLDFTCPE